MTDFNEKQRKELESSAIDSHLAEEEILTPEGDRALDSFFYALPPDQRRNDGRALDRWMKKYDLIRKHGGMAFYGVNPLTGERTECLSFKPNVPISPDRKYENPPGAEVQAIYPAMTYGLWKLAADRFEVALPESALLAEPNDLANGFWMWVFDNDIPIILTEGAKKALSAMSAGFPCVALTGIWNGVKANRDENGRTESYDLIPTLRHLANCKIYIAFDRDQASKTIKSVIQARSVLAKALMDIDCECYSIRWDSKYKGLDDLIAGCGVSVLEDAIEGAQRLTGEIPDFKKKPAANIIAEAIAKEWKGRVRFDIATKMWQVYKEGVWESQESETMDALFYCRIVEDAPEINSHNYLTTITKIAKGLLSLGK
jgi:Domain of unknown function (DUF3854)